MAKQVGGPQIKLNDGHEIPLIGFGTYKIDQSEIEQALDAALEVGYRHIDTATGYNNESQIGIALESVLPKYGLERKDIFITTKLTPRAGTNKEDVPLVVGESLRNLRTSYVDLCLIHYPKAAERDNEALENAVDRRECWLALEKLHAQGIIRSIGVSNYEVCHLQEISKYSSMVPAVNQCEFHPHFRRDEIRRYCKEHNIFFQAFSSLGRYKPELIEDPIIVELANKKGATVALVLLAFATSQNIGIVPKSASRERIRSNWMVNDLRLSEEDISHLNSIDKNSNYIKKCVGWLVT